MPQEKEPRRRGQVFVPYIIVFLIALENEASFISENVMTKDLPLPCGLSCSRDTLMFEGSRI
jgi:hypothetical protein